MTTLPNNTYIEELTWDRQANAAYLAIRSEHPGPRYAARTVRAQTKDGTLLATLDFDADGALLGVELLDAGTQLTAAMKAAATDITGGRQGTEPAE
ncbi:DUF2283 domain-containing protein [Nocardia niwae]|uniref:DUF2283 domain-containing protein n=1 Tax=Nocardia niwae TaxID=626084 RepID=A0ABV2X7T6_9NOCA|nr:DUF2283 domain-containing protein [Nocardia niwae]